MSVLDRFEAWAGRLARSVPGVDALACAAWLTSREAVMGTSVRPCRRPRRASAAAALWRDDLSFEEIVGQYDCLLGGSDRRALGAFYTPQSIAHAIVSRVGVREGDNVCDPACGTGQFLVEAIRRGAQVYGADVDPIAIEVCRVRLELIGGRLPRRSLICGDALLSRKLRPWRGRFDAVISNPPFVDSESLARSHRAVRARIAIEYRTARGNWDLCAPFVELACGLTAGAVAMILPRRALASDWAAALHKLMLARGIREIIELPDDAFGTMTQPTVACVLGRADGPVRISRVVGGKVCAMHRVPRAALRRAPSGFLTAAMEGGPAASDHTLAEYAEFSDGATTAEAYRIAPKLSSVPETKPMRLAAGWLRVINTGLIDPYVHRWATRPMRYLKRTIERPSIAEVDLAAISRRRAAQAHAPKVLVAGLASRIEAVAVGPGVVCGKSAVCVIPRAGVCPYALAAWLNSERVGNIYRSMFGGRGFGRASLAIGPRQLERLPGPSEPPPPERGVLRPGSELSRISKRLHRRVSPADLVAVERLVARALGQSAKPRRRRKASDAAASVGV